MDDSLQEGVVIDEGADILDPNGSAAQSYNCGLPYYRWLHPHAKTKRLQYFNQILPDIYARTAHLLPEEESFDDLVKTELPRRWHDKDLLHTLRRRLFVATKYWGRFRNMMGRISAFDIITIQNGQRALHTLQIDTAKAVEDKEKLLTSYFVDDTKKTMLRKGYEERKEYTEEMLSILSQIRQSVDSFVEELDKLLREGMEREKLTEKDLEKARGQLKKRRQKEAKKKQRKREASKRQKGDKGDKSGVLLANASDIAALAAAGYTLEPTDPGADPSLLLPPLQSVHSSPEPNAHAHPHHHHHHVQHTHAHPHSHVHNLHTHVHHALAATHTDDENHTVEH